MRGGARFVVVLVVGIVVAATVSGSAVAEEREHHDWGFVLTDSGVLGGAAGSELGLGISLNGPAGTGANAGNYKAYSFVIDDGDAPADYDIIVEYDTTQLNDLGQPEDVCTANFDVVLRNGTGHVVGSDTDLCDGGRIGPTGDLAAGSYMLELYAVHGVSEFDLELEVIYNQ